MVNMNKRMRLQSRNDEDYESPASLPITSSNLASSSVKKDRQDQEERGEKDKKENVRASVIPPLMTTLAQTERASEIIPVMSTPGASVETGDEEKKKLTEELNSMRLALSAERSKVNDAAKKITKLEREISQSKINFEREKKEFLDNLRNGAETELQCAVCTEVFVFACTLNCGHSFCHHCIHEWWKEKRNCPVCRTKITEMVDDKTLDKIVDKMYELFVSEDGRAARASLKEERLKLRNEWDTFKMETDEQLERAEQWYDRKRGEDESIARFRDMEHFLYQLANDTSYFRPELLNDFSTFVNAR